MTAKEAVQEAIDLLEMDAEATEHDEDAARWTEAAAVLREQVLPGA